METASYIEGIPIPYLPKDDNVIVLILLACFLLSAFELSQCRRFLVNMAKDFISHRERNSIFDSFLPAEMRYLFLFIIQTCILTGVALFCYFLKLQPEVTRHIHPLYLLSIYIGISIAFFLLKRLVYDFIGWVFFDKEMVRLWRKSYSTLLYCFGLILLPYILLVIFFNLSLDSIEFLSLFIIIGIEFLILYKWISLFCMKLSDCIPLFLYFCALEIIPTLLLYKGVYQLNNLLC